MRVRGGIVSVASGVICDDWVDDRIGTIIDGDKVYVCVSEEFVLQSNHNEEPSLKWLKFFLND